MNIIENRSKGQNVRESVAFCPASAQVMLKSTRINQQLFICKNYARFFPQLLDVPHNSTYEAETMVPSLFQLSELRLRRDKIPALDHTANAGLVCCGICTSPQALGSCLCATIADTDRRKHKDVWGL